MRLLLSSKSEKQKKETIQLTSLIEGPYGMEALPQQGSFYLASHMASDSQERGCHETGTQTALGRHYPPGAQIS